MAKADPPPETYEPKLIRLFTGDFERIAVLYPQVSTAMVIRALVRAHINKVEGASRIGRTRINRVDLGGLLDE